jgi:hypothetical protein
LLPWKRFLIIRDNKPGGEGGGEQSGFGLKAVVKRMLFPAEKRIQIALAFRL